MMTDPNRNVDASMPQSSDDTSEELSWLAFRYVHDELSPDEREAFDVRLADDLAACEAVAAAVALSDRVRGAMSSTAANNLHLARSHAPQSRRRASKQLTASLAIAAALLVAFGVWKLVENQQHGVQVAVAWSDLLDSFGPADDIFGLTDPEAAGDDAAVDEDGSTVSQTANAAARTGDESADEDLSEVAPSWMLAAVEIQHSATSPERSEPSPGDAAPLDANPFNVDPVLEN
jgi:hypothetical protein